MEFFDAYEFRARFLPGLICILPALVTFAVILRESSPLLGTSAAAVIGLAVSVLLGHFVRDHAKRKEALLFTEWGGMPSVALLRHRDRRLDPAAKQRCHAQLQKMLPDLAAPTPDDEIRDPLAADTVYEAWCSHLRAKSRSREEFPILFSENVSYGFRRNLWALKAIGTAMASACCMVIGGWSLTGNTAAPDPLLAAPLVLSGIWIILWLTLMTKEWVRQAADRYARALLDVAPVLSAKPS